MNYNDIISALNGLMPSLGAFGALYGDQMANFGQFAPILNYAAGVNASNNQYNLGTAQLQAEREQNLRNYGLAMTNQELAARQWQQQFGEGSRQFDVANALQNRMLDWQQTNAANQLAWEKENAGQNRELQKWLAAQQKGQSEQGLAEQAREFDTGQGFQREMAQYQMPFTIMKQSAYDYNPSTGWAKDRTGYSVPGNNVIYNWARNTMERGGNPYAMAGGNLPYMK